MAVQQDISLAKNEEKVGQIFKVIVDKKITEDSCRLKAKSR